MAQYIRDVNHPRSREAFQIRIEKYCSAAQLGASLAKEIDEVLMLGDPAMNPQIFVGSQSTTSASTAGG